MNKSTRFEVNSKPVYTSSYDLMKDFTLAGKSCFYSQEHLQKSKKMVSTSRNKVLLYTVKNSVISPHFLV